VGLNLDRASNAESQLNEIRKQSNLVALVAVAVIVGGVGTEERAAIEPKNWGLRLLSNSEPAQVLVRACGNCHSNHTDWPWYRHVAPVSWWIARHVREGREKLDFSEWDPYSVWQKRDKLESMCGLISTGRMPPQLYTAMHPEAKLTEKEESSVCLGEGRNDCGKMRRTPRAGGKHSVDRNSLVAFPRT